ncbi:MAG TPA: SPOR domain-containing protein [Bacteroidota bacterium]|nr:SPOR domain-containing protein [Bacteroidota bacterium]
MGRLFIVAALVIVWGCGSAEQPRKTTPEHSSPKEFLAKYEKAFRPSDYKLDIKVIKAAEAEQFNALHPAQVYAVAAAETIPGFRIQVLLTQEIDEANTTLTTLEQQLPDEFAYMAYDAPTYKIRVGNFQERTSANPVLKKLVDLGYKEAWIVPDMILKNPPQKLPDAFIEPKRLIENHR